MFDQIDGFSIRKSSAMIAAPPTDQKKPIKVVLPLELSAPPNLSNGGVL